MSEYKDGRGDYYLGEGLREENDRLKEMLSEYAAHTAWRCSYRSRYGRCVCGLDDAMVRLGLEPVPVDDPEAKPLTDMEKLESEPGWC